MRAKNKLIFGVGVNDADYKVYANDKICPFYAIWKDMLRRCYDNSYHDKQPTYKWCSVCPEWLTFSNFKSWMEKQDWVGKHLDKDLLCKGNKVYSPDFCIFVTKAINNFTNDKSNSRGKYPIGVTWHKLTQKFQAYCTYNGKMVTLGYFDNEQEAHSVWKDYKHKIACEIAETVQDTRLADALRKRYV